MESANSLLIRIQLKLVIYTVCLRVTLFFRLTPPSRPNKVGLKCPSARPYVRPQSFFDFSEIWYVCSYLLPHL